MLYIPVAISVVDFVMQRDSVHPGGTEWGPACETFSDLGIRIGPCKDLGVADLEMCAMGCPLTLKTARALTLGKVRPDLAKQSRLGP